jgi:hypothetical protein
MAETEQLNIGSVATWSTDPKTNLPELGKGFDAPEVGTFMGGEAPTVAVVYGKDTADQRVYRLSLDDAAWLGTRLIAEAERAKHVWRGAPCETNPAANDIQPESGR